jgi:hypothetical protein
MNPAIPNIPHRKTPFRVPAAGIPRGRGAWRPAKKASPKAASKKATAIQPRTRGIPAAVYGTGYPAVEFGSPVMTPAVLLLTLYVDFGVKFKGFFPYLVLKVKPLL